MIQVEFVKNSGIYYAGMVAAFEPEIAQKYIDSGAAVSTAAPEIETEIITSKIRKTKNA
jgi:hypothetical protein